MGPSTNPVLIFCRIFDPSSLPIVSQSPISSTTSTHKDVLFWKRKKVVHNFYSRNFVCCKRCKPKYRTVHAHLLNRIWRTSHLLYHPTPSPIQSHFCHKPPPPHCGRDLWMIPIANSLWIWVSNFCVTSVNIRGRKGIYAYESNNRRMQTISI